MFALRQLVIFVIFCAGILVAQGVYQADGSLFTKVPGKSRSPVVVIDTVQIIAGFGKLGLRKTFSSKREHSVAPTKPTTLYAVITPILGDTTKTVYYYGYALNLVGDTLTVKSSGGTADTGCVAVHIYLR